MKTTKTKTHTIIVDDNITIIHKNNINIKGLFKSYTSQSSIDSNKENLDDLFK
jgi:hypothetical protein